MRGRILTVLACLALAMLSPATWAEGDHPLQDAWNRAVKKAGEKAREMERLGEPRVVKRGAKPEIIIKGDTITVDGKAVAIGGTLDSWKKALPGTPSCELGDPKSKFSATICYWDGIGTELMTFDANLDSVEQAKFYMSFEHFEASAQVITYPDGTKVMPKGKTHPDHAFPGYLEIDGYGIDAKTEFWEVRRHLDPQRKVYCGMQDCSHPEGLLGGRVHLSFRLNNTSEHGNIYEVMLWTTETSPPTPVKK